MEAVIRQVSEIDSSERRVLERVLGLALQDNQQIIIQVVTPANQSAAPSASRLPAWCDVYAGLSDEQVADLEGVILRRSDLARPSE